MKRALIVTDAWSPQTNGVVTTLESVAAHLPRFGYAVDVIHPGLFSTVPLPGYPEIRVARNPAQIGRMLAACAPDTVHLATEGPLGIWARRYLCRQGIPFTTSLHTRFPEYVACRTGLSPDLGYRFLRWFHRPAARTLCTTESYRAELERRGFAHLVVWGRGVDTNRFRPLPRMRSARPRLLYVGRVAVEKNVEAFLELGMHGELVVVGDGPARAALERRFPDAAWRGYRYGEELVAEYAAADVLVFPSRTDTFGLVLLEAMACGTPVAAYPVTGPVDVVAEGVTGILSEDLGDAVRRALPLDRDRCRTHVESCSWGDVAGRLAANFVDVR
jgi:glycosyltransferase involved in cell wall biosynthesis